MTKLTVEQLLLIVNNKLRKPKKINKMSHDGSEYFKEKAKEKEQRSMDNFVRFIEAKTKMSEKHNCNNANLCGFGWSAGNIHK